MTKLLLMAEDENIAQRTRGLKSKAAWVVSCFGFGNLWVMASLRETALPAPASHAKAQSRKKTRKVRRYCCLCRALDSLRMTKIPPRLSIVVPAYNEAARL